MASRIDQERVQLLIEQLGHNDRIIGEGIGVTQSTVWRLRHRKISKVSKYLNALQAFSGDPTPSTQGLTIEGLAQLAERSPGLKAVLASLLQFMQEDATSPSG